MSVHDWRYAKTQRNIPNARYHVRAWGSDRRGDLNYETASIPRGLERIYPFIDIQPLERRPEPIKDLRHGQEA